MRLLDYLFDPTQPLSEDDGNQMFYDALAFEHHLALYPEEIRGETFAVVTDLHGGELFSREKISRLIKTLQRTIEILTDDDIVEISNNRETRHKEHNKPKRVPDNMRKIKSGYIYIIHGGGYYKIGYAQEPKKRIKNLGVSSPFSLECLFVIPTDDMEELEEELHAEFAEQRENGEWFSLSIADIAWIKATYKTQNL